MERDDDTSAISCSNTEPILEAGEVRPSEIEFRRKEAKCGIESVDGQDIITPKDNLLVRVCRRRGQGKAINHASAGLTFGRGANQIIKDMGRLMPTKEEFVFAQRRSNYNELKEIVIALIQGGWEGTTSELIQRGKEIQEALKNA